MRTSNGNTNLRIVLNTHGRVSHAILWCLSPRVRAEAKRAAIFTRWMRSGGLNQRQSSGEARCVASFGKWFRSGCFEQECA